MRNYRWSDSDRYVGPLTLASAPKGQWTIVLSSVRGEDDDDDWSPCRLRLTGFRRTVIIPLPAWLKPERKKVMASWDEKTVKRMGRNWYWEYMKREYGFSVHEGFLQVFLGRQTHDSETTQDWCTHLPWTQWRFVRKSLYDLDGNHFADEVRTGNWHHDSAVNDKAQAACTKVVFEFADYDGERLRAECHVEEMEWKFGTGWFKWLSWFRKPKVHRTLDLKFSGEVGRRKGSWKGGTIGSSCEVKAGDTPEMAFKRYCAENDMTFVEPIRLWLRSPVVADLNTLCADTSI